MKWLGVIVIIVVSVLVFHTHFGATMGFDDASSTYFGQSWQTPSQKRTTGWAGRMLDLITGGFQKPQAQRKVTQFKSGDCVDMVAITGDSMFGMGRFQVGDFYDVRYCIGEVCRNGRFEYSTGDKGVKYCWRFVGDIAKTCGTWKFSEGSTDPCPFPTDKCRSLRSYFNDYHSGTMTFKDGSSYEYKDGIIACTTLK